MLNALDDSVGGSLVLRCGRAECLKNPDFPGRRKKSIVSGTHVCPVKAELAVTGSNEYRWIKPLTH